MLLNLENVKADMRNIIISSSNKIPISEEKIEIVERKGLGHPDTICDALGEEVSRAFCKEYLKEFGTLLHHNVDKFTLIAGQSKPKFGGGTIKKPISIVLAGRATSNVGNKKISINNIAITVCKDYLEKNIFNLVPHLHAIIEPRFGEGSADLQEIVLRKDKMPAANDTSFGIGFYPLSKLEKTVYQTEKFLSSVPTRKKYPWIGEDIKVMGLRESDEITLTVADAFVDKYISDIEDYKEKKEKTIELLKKQNQGMDIQLNSADNYKKESVYITVTGLSAEMGDDGAIGRGNRANGLITPNRPMSIEAVCGKNPSNHVGKIYNILAGMIAKDIYEKNEGIEEVYVKLLSQIGKPIDQPKVAEVQIVAKEPISKTENKIKKITDEHLENIREVTQLFIKGKTQTF